MLAKTAIEEIRARSDIADVIGTYLTLRKNGATFKALCPFHKEKTPSFHVNPQRQIFHCFGCGAGGDVFKYVMLQENVDFMGAVRLLAERAGVPIEDDRYGGGGAGASAGASQDARRIKDRLYALHEDVATYYQECLEKDPAAQEARDYLDRRKLDQAARLAFRIGYAPNSYDTLIPWGQKHGYSPEELEQAGLVARAPETNKRYDRFRHRIMFAISNEQGRVIAFSGRILTADKQSAKYVNSPETSLFRKSQVLFALDRARQAILDRREALVCEGQIDVIRCHLAGVDWAVAAQGTAFTEEHARKLKRYADSALLVFDGDEAGRHAALRTAGVLLQAGLTIRIAALPPGDDPDSYILNHGPDGFRELIGGATPALDFQIKAAQAGGSIGDEATHLRTVAAVLDFIALAPNSVQREELLRQAAQRLYIAPEALRVELLPRLRRATPRTDAPTPPPPVDPAAPAVPSAPEPDVPPSPDERVLAEHLAANPALAPLVEQYLPLALIRHALCREFVTAVLAAHTQPDGNFMDMVAERDDESRRLTTFAALIVSAPGKPTTEYADDKVVHDVILRLWRAQLTARRSALASLPDSGSDTERTRLTFDLQKLRHWETGEPVIRAQMG